MRFFNRLLLAGLVATLGGAALAAAPEPARKLSLIHISEPTRPY